MGKMIEQIRIGKTSCPLCACSALDRFGPDPQITIPARGFWKCRTTRPERSSHSITRQDSQNFLHHGRQPKKWTLSRTSITRQSGQAGRLLKSLASGQMAVRVRHGGRGHTNNAPCTPMGNGATGCPPLMSVQVRPRAPFLNLMLRAGCEAQRPPRRVPGYQRGRFVASRPVTPF